MRYAVIDFYNDEVISFIGVYDSYSRAVGKAYQVASDYINDELNNLYEPGTERLDAEKLCNISSLQNTGYGAEFIKHTTDRKDNAVTHLVYILPNEEETT